MIENMEIKIIRNPLVILTFILAFTLVTLSLIIWGFGVGYQQNLVKFDLPNSQSTIEIPKNETVKKITIKNTQDNGCIEVTPDGAVRIYKTCGVHLDKAARLSQNKYITDLYRLVTETKLENCPSNTQGVIYTLEIETEKGIKIACFTKSNLANSTLQTNGNIGSVNEELTNIAIIINNILGDIPVTNIPLQLVFTSPLPSVSIQSSSQPGIFPSLTPTIIGNLHPDQNFTCGFADNNGDNKKPFNISNIICSSEPSPVPQ